MSDLPPEFDFKLVPDWLKEQPAKNPYANYEGERERPDRRDDRGPRGDRSRPPRREGGPRPEGRSGRPPGDRPQRNDRNDRGPKRTGSGHGPQRDSRGGADRGGNRGERSGRPREGAQGEESRFARPQHPPEPPAPVKIEFFPEQHFVEAVLSYIRNTGHAYALFDLARSFLVKADRHRVKITVTEPEVTLYQVGKMGAVTLDPVLAEKSAFRQLQKDFYVEEVLEREPIKGNFTNVARCRLSGEILGPTSHHSYQLALRKHYEQRFSRRMSFQNFLREIETSNKPEDIEAWKEAARHTTVWKTIGEGEQQVFTELAQVEAHFRKTHQPQVLQSGTSFEMSGVASRNLPDRRISRAVQAAWEKERGFPGQMMFHLREQFLKAGLHFFKHHKRQQFISTTRPQIIKDLSGLSENIIRIIRALEEKPGCTRADLAHKFFEAHQEDPELPKMKSILASDLHWLRQAGHIIEFSDGTIDLPRKKAEEDPQKPQQKPQKQAQAAAPKAGEAKKAPAAEAPAPEAVAPAPEAVAPEVEAAPEALAPAATAQPAADHPAAEATPEE